MSDRYPEFPPETKSVTEVLTAVGLIDSRWFTPQSAERGTQIHLACQYLAEDRLDWESLDPRIEAHVRSYEKFLSVSRWVAKATEVKMADLSLGICGTFDVAFEQGRLITDLKSGVSQRWHRAQLGAYWFLDGAHGDTKTAALYLQDDGSIAKLVPHNAYEGWRDFKTALNFLRLKEQYT